LSCLDLLVFDQSGLSPPAFAKIRCEYGERRRDDKVVMAASGFQPAGLALPA
jgi:hypothetical protein